MYTLADSAASRMTLLDFPAPAGRVVSGAFDEALETNPVPLFILSRELNAAREVGPRLSAEDANDQAKRAGVSVKVPEDGISNAALAILIERKRDQAARDLLFGRREGAAAAVGMFGVGLAGAFMDPVNAASGYIPVLSGTRYAATLARAASIGQRATVRAATGAAEGAVGASLVEMPTIALRRDLQDDYSLYDSLTNITFGTLASTGLRTVSGLARDRWRGIQAARQEDFLRSVEPDQWAATRAAYEQQLERSMFSDLEGGFERGQGASEGLLARWQMGRDADEAVARMQRRMSDQEIDRFVEAERAMRSEAAAVPDDRVLLGPSGIADRKFREMDLAEVRDRLRRGEGLIIVPGNEREVAAAISDETHALAMKTAVAQAVEGRRIEVDAVLRQDPVFGVQRMGQEGVRARAISNMAPENKVGADRAASQRADESIAVSEGPAARRGGTEPPPPRGSRRAEAAGSEGKSPELVEAESLLADTQLKLKQAANDAGAEPPQPGKGIEQSEDVAKASRAIAACLNRTGA